jgi:hypothetical protein
LRTQRSAKKDWEQAKRALPTEEIHAEWSRLLQSLPYIDGNELRVRAGAVKMTSPKIRRSYHAGAARIEKIGLTTPSHQKGDSWGRISPEASPTGGKGLGRGHPCSFLPI